MVIADLGGRRSRTGRAVTGAGAGPIRAAPASSPPGATGPRPTLDARVGGIAGGRLVLAGARTAPTRARPRVEPRRVTASTGPPAPAPSTPSATGPGPDFRAPATMAAVAPTIAAMRRRGPTWATRWLISSFTMSTIDHCRRIAPDIPTGFLLYEPSDDAISATRRHGHDAIHPWAGAIDHERVAACHRAGLVVNTWTCNDPDRLRELADCGVDGVCTDVPDLALEAVGRAGDRRLNPRWGTRA